jgi:hypothetical protein
MAIKFYIIMILKMDEEGIISVTWSKHPFLSFDVAKREALEIGPDALVVLMSELEIWDYDRLKE